ncbi:ribosomal RNA small subunit methyltransferase G [Halolactibacillus alkaliphilus]|uniref:Ribosomal RNA small subunit methyltransferase G n=1 Tax=Halolactibacillus alkaliphilus TaxID=442899 RepID=A0A511X0E9_9BACI|nr:16S rRNA (guanine(527)-N(7))-methyltransferase RsmG [Halolactibacillus alkaliphilus]GEN56418.1 ribosomal RNA small subunit methyltransferase G [Halolactibacillus alkaliphilus]GGN64548.1 ribosomal RNA small subunit methyltransferase G [Halolactibacillus alkaliphilus]SFO60905.1 16S rRNA m(7)G-527 methyltransferase [Halolactibacillus alkaliphilus]
MTIEEFVARLKAEGIELSHHQIKQFDIYFKTLVEWNEKINLTAITEETEVYLKHFYDSITASFYVDFKEPLTVCDVGAGAGFPSLPLKICFPQLKVTIVDSLKKRITFLNHLAAELELTDVAFYHDRAELFGRNKQFRHSFDLVLARAVAKTSVLSELCLPLVKTGGQFIAMKGPNAEVELKEAKNAIELLGGELDSIFTFDLPEDQGERNIVRILKRRQTPKQYPRKPGTPNKSPLS